MQKELRRYFLESEFSLLRTNEPYILEGYGTYYFVDVKRIDLAHEKKFYFERLSHGPNSSSSDVTGLIFGEEKMSRLLKSNKVRKPSDLEFAKALLIET
jgi:hypothetical protein